MLALRTCYAQGWNSGWSWRLYTALMLQQELRYSPSTLKRMLLNSVCTAPGEMAVTLQSSPCIGETGTYVSPQSLLAVQRGECHKRM